MTGKKTGGRIAGTPNKSTKQLRSAVRSSVPFDELIEKLVELSREGNLQAIKMLFEYAYGRPLSTDELEEKEEEQERLSGVFNLGGVTQ